MQLEKDKIPEARTVHINDRRLNRNFPDNRVKTSKYTIINFIPKALFAQFLRLANFYFLISTIVQCIPKISPLDPLTAIIPLAFVLGTSMLREALEDYVKHLVTFDPALIQ